MMLPKSPREENAHYRAMACGQECTLRVPGVCCGDPATTVLCHSNRLADGKGRGLKSHDWAGVHGCHACHAWLDQGAAPRAEKEALFDQARRRMQQLLARIVRAGRGKDKAAAQWALDRLAAAGYLSSQ